MIHEFGWLPKASGKKPAKRLVFRGGFRRWSQFHHRPGLAGPKMGTGQKRLVGDRPGPASLNQPQSGQSQGPGLPQERRRNGLIVISGSPTFLERIKAKFGWFVRGDQLDGALWTDIGFSAGAPIASVHQ